jgi:hypothetical protein
VFRVATLEIPLLPRERLGEGEFSLVLISLITESDIMMNFVLDYRYLDSVFNV